MLEIYFINAAATTVTDVSLVLKDSDTESENFSLLIRIFVSKGFKSCIIYLTYMYNTGPDQLECPIFENS